MQKEIHFTYNNVNTEKYAFEYEDVEQCPICKTKISPIYIASSLDRNNQASVFHFCRGCKNTFITKYSIFKCHNDYGTIFWYKMKKILSSEPNHFVKQDFDKNIRNLSPQFDKIYNQALAAESSQLDEIAGLGYRKAMEFLVKDFAIYQRPDDEDKIKSMLLGQCINAYINNDQIKTLATRSAWIGNDEAHYIRKQEDRDVQDMKSFIQAIVYFIGMILITEDASTMEPK
ncbi:MAG: DUF4145 domain-containing protein [Eubacterium sp.]|nr:DUF4145 domain-containing protein [Eubacterium sp.]